MKSNVINNGTQSNSDSDIEWNSELNVEQEESDTSVYADFEDEKSSEEEQDLEVLEVSLS